MINTLVSEVLFSNAQALGTLQLDDNCEPRTVYKGMRVTITQNRDKMNNVVNGMCAIVHTLHNSTLILRLAGNILVSIYPVTFWNNNQQITAYPIRLAYATTICKVQGQTLETAVIWFDIDDIPAGTAYVAMSRVKRQQDIYFLTPLKPLFFKTIT